MRRSLALLAAAAAGAFALAADDKPAPGLTPIAPAKLSRTDPISYEKDVAPIFKDKCQVCHSGKEIQGKFDLGTHAALMKGGKRGPAVVAGKSADSLLFKLSSHQLKPIMPPKSENNPLTPQEVAILKQWIDEGAKGPAVDVRVRPKVVVGLPPALVKPVRAVAVSPDKSTIAAGRGNQVHLFDAKTGEFKKTLSDPDLKTPDGKPASAAHLSLVEAMAYSPDGKTLATGSFQELTLWDPETGKVKKRVGGFVDRVVAIAYSPDGKLFATGGGAPTEDGEIKLFDADGKQVGDIKGGHSDTVFGAAFSPDNKKLATSAADKFVKVFEVPSGKFIKSFEGHTHHVMDVAWSPDGTKLVSAGADNFVKIWDYEKGEKLKDAQGHTKQVTRVVMLAGKTAQFLTASGDASVRLWGLDNGNSTRTLGDAKDFVYAVAASPDGAVVATGGEEGVVRLYEGGKGVLVKAMFPPGEEPKKDEPKKDEPKKK